MESISISVLLPLNMLSVNQGSNLYKGGRKQGDHGLDTNKVRFRSRQSARVSVLQFHGLISLAHCLPERQHLLKTRYKKTEIISL